MPRRYAQAHVARTAAGLNHHNTLVAGRGSHVSVLLRSNSGAMPLRDRRYRITLGDGEVLQGVTDAEGLIYHPDVPPGDHALEVEGFAGRGWVPTTPAWIVRREVRVEGFLPYHPDRDPPGDAPPDPPDAETVVLYRQGGRGHA